jgi:hypothetical protein
MTAKTMDAAPRRVPQTGRWTYVAFAAIFVLIAFGGFVPTYWAKLATGSFSGGPILHVHGAFFFTWTLFFLFQTTLVATGRTPDHRAWGLAGISIATAMVFTVVLATIHSMNLADTMGMGDAARRFTIVPLSAAVLFSGFLVAAIVNVKRPEIHKRWMMLAMIPLMHAATARVFLTLFAPPDAKGPPPVIVSVPPALLVDLLIVAAMLIDWRTRGRPHFVYAIGLALLVADQVLSVPVSATPAWMSIASAVQALGR